MPDLDELDELFADIPPPPTINGEDLDLEIEVEAEAPDPLPELPVVPESEVLYPFIVRNPEAFRTRKMRTLFTEAFSEQDGFLPNPIDAIEWSAGVCQQPTTGILVAAKGDLWTTGSYHGLVIIDWNQNDPWAVGPWVLHFYSTGVDAVRVMAPALIEWLNSVGQTSFYGFNRTGASDAAYARFLSSHFDSEPQSTLMRLSVKEQG
jgi:hypothetical protein